MQPKYNVLNLNKCYTTTVSKAPVKLLNDFVVYNWYVAGVALSGGHYRLMDHLFQRQGQAQLGESVLSHGPAELYRDYKIKSY